jgi:hypothetical protein
MHHMNTTRRPGTAPSAGHLIGRTGRPRPFWLRVSPTVVRHVAKTTPWATLISGCLAGTALLAVLAYSADTSRSPLGQNQVRLAFLPAIAALAFVPSAAFRPVSQATPVPAWLATVGQTLMVVPVLALTCWGQLRLMSGTIPTTGTARPPAAIYPLIAQLTGWCALTVAAAACCDRSRYADLGGAVAAPASLATIALAWYTPDIRSVLNAPPATSHAAAIAWYITTAAALALSCVMTGDSWRRFGRHRRKTTARRA